MQIELIEDTGGFQTLRQEWHELLGDSAGDSLFLTWEWLYSWWKHLAEDRELYLMSVRDRGGLTGLAPFAVRPSRVTRFRLFRALEFMGTGSVGSDYLDVISRRGLEQDVAGVLGDHLGAEKLALRLTQLSADGSLAAAFADELERRGWRRAEAETNVCPLVRLPARSWESYLTTLGSKHRCDFRRRLTNLYKRYDVQFEQVVTEEQRRDALAALFALHDSRWRDRGGSDAFHTRTLQSFHEEFSRLALERGWLRLFVLSLDGKPAAALYGFRYRQTFYEYQKGFDPSYGRDAVGLISTGLAIKNAIEEGATEYDFLHGAEPYKFRWAHEVRALQRLELYPPRLRGWLCQGAVETDRVVRRLARWGLPQMTVQSLVRGRRARIATSLHNAASR